MERKIADKTTVKTVDAKNIVEKIVKHRWKENVQTSLRKNVGTQEFSGFSFVIEYVHHLLFE